MMTNETHSKSMNSAKVSLELDLQHGGESAFSSLSTVQPAFLFWHAVLVRMAENNSLVMMCRAY